MLLLVVFSLLPHTSGALLILVDLAWCPYLVCELCATNLMLHYMFPCWASLALAVGSVVLLGALRPCVRRGRCQLPILLLHHWWCRSFGYADNLHGST